MHVCAKIRVRAFPKNVCVNARARVYDDKETETERERVCVCVCECVNVNVTCMFVSASEGEGENTCIQTQLCAWKARMTCRRPHRQCSCSPCRALEYSLWL